MNRQEADMWAGKTPEGGDTLHQAKRRAQRPPTPIGTPLSVGGSDSEIEALRKALEGLAATVVQLQRDVRVLEGENKYLWEALNKGGTVVFRDTRKYA